LPWRQAQSTEALQIAREAISNSLRPWRRLIRHRSPAPGRPARSACSCRDNGTGCLNPREPRQLRVWIGQHAGRGAGPHRWHGAKLTACLPPAPRVVPHPSPLPPSLMSTPVKSKIRLVLVDDSEVVRARPSARCLGAETGAPTHRRSGERRHGPSRRARASSPDIVLLDIRPARWERLRGVPPDFCGSCLRRGWLVLTSVVDENAGG